MVVWIWLKGKTPAALSKTASKIKIATESAQVSLKMTTTHKDEKSVSFGTREYVGISRIGKFLVYGVKCPHPHLPLGIGLRNTKFWICEAWPHLTQPWYLEIQQTFYCTVIKYLFIMIIDFLGQVDFCLLSSKWQWTTSPN